ALVGFCADLLEPDPRAAANARPRAQGRKHRPAGAGVASLLEARSACSGECPSARPGSQAPTYGSRRGFGRQPTSSLAAPPVTVGATQGRASGISPLAPPQRDADTAAYARARGSKKAKR